MPSDHSARGEGGTGEAAIPVEDVGLVAEVVVLLLDATRGLESQDLKIANLVLEEGRALMIAINKWEKSQTVVFVLTVSKIFPI